MTILVWPNSLTMDEITLFNMLIIQKTPLQHWVLQMARRTTLNSIHHKLICLNYMDILIILQLCRVIITLRYFWIYNIYSHLHKGLPDETNLITLHCIILNILNWRTKFQNRRKKILVGWTTWDFALQLIIFHIHWLLISITLNAWHLLVLMSLLISTNWRRLFQRRMPNIARSRWWEGWSGTSLFGICKSFQVCKWKSIPHH